ncbi:cyclase/dehydrase [Thioalkalivibrio denitrificans]|uniref:cyclase/dehydrase n=1 Tax=Thioalkalivibrio denitrificans TaxID=108003 RepID=UPI001FE68C76|nr:cyclase/dehydrase [Thioalkalivibrio denitrificans]
MCGFVIVLTLAWVGLFTLVAAAESQIQTRYDGQRLDFHLDVLLSAPEAHVVAVIHDYDRLVLVFPLVVDSGLLEDFGNGVQRVRAHMKGCVLVFCRQLKHVLDVHPSPGAGAWGSARSVPGQSDVRAGHLSWRTEAPSPEQTRLTLSGWLEPDVWVPPLLGPPVVRRAVERHFREAMPRLEEAARNWLPPEP